MYYISLDLEWNQAYIQKAIAVQRRINSHLHGEVIQIGAVKLDENANICGSYSIIVKPKYFTKIHRHVMLLTGITQQKIDAGISLDEAAESFKKWCGDNYVFLTWGPDDIPMFIENLDIHKFPTEWLEPTYDLQAIYGKQIENTTKQISLEAAMERLNIPQNLPAHDALNDAYFTALVAKSLDLKRGIAEYTKKPVRTLSEKIYGDSDVGETGFSAFSEVDVYHRECAEICPICGSKMNIISPLMHIKGHRHLSISECITDGKFLTTTKLSKNFDGTYRAKISIERLTPEEESKLIEKQEARAKSTLLYRKHRRKRQQKSTPPVEKQPQ